MVLRLVSGPMREKSNKTEPLAHRQKLLPTVRLRIFLFLGFSTTRKTVNVQKIMRDFREIPGIPKIFKVFRIRETPGSRKIFSNLIILAFFLILSISDLIFSILFCCFDKLSLSFPFFRQSEEKVLISPKPFVLKILANFEN